MNSPAPSTAHDAPSGWFCALTAFGLWGVIPLYFRALAGVPPIEILAQRAWWSFVVLSLVIALLRKWSDVRQALATRHTRRLLTVSTLLIAANWLTYIYAVSIEQVVQAGLGYFITPLANVLLGVIVLGERLRPPHVVALFLAAAGVVVLATLGAGVPWISLFLAATFSLYGLVRKLAHADAVVGLFVETLLLAPAAVACIGYWHGIGTSSLAVDEPRLAALLLASGPATTVPLVCFGAAARRLRMTTLGFLQFLTPVLQVSVALFVFREPLTTAHRWALPLIGLAVVIYLADTFRRR